MKLTLTNSIVLSMLGCTSLPPSDKDGVYTFTGNLATESYTKFEKALATKKFKTVIFSDCDGGNGLAGLNIARDIKLAKLHTVASGRVISACAIAYMGGVERTIDTSRDVNGLQFHGGFDPITRQPAGPIKNQKVLDYLYLDTNFKFSKQIEDIILNTKLPAEGAYFFRQLIRGKFRDITLYCDGDESLKEKNCRVLSGITLESEGIVTK